MPRCILSVLQLIVRVTDRHSHSFEISFPHTDDRSIVPREVEPLSFAQLRFKLHVVNVKHVEVWFSQFLAFSLAGPSSFLFHWSQPHPVLTLQMLRHRQPLCLGRHRRAHLAGYFRPAFKIIICLYLLFKWSHRTTRHAFDLQPLCIYNYKGVSCHILKLFSFIPVRNRLSRKFCALLRNVSFLWGSTASFPFSA